MKPNDYVSQANNTSKYTDRKTKVLCLALGINSEFAELVSASAETLVSELGDCYWFTMCLAAELRLLPAVVPNNEWPRPYYTMIKASSNPMYQAVALQAQMREFIVNCLTDIGAISGILEKWARHKSGFDDGSTIRTLCSEPLAQLIHHLGAYVDFSGLTLDQVLRYNIDKLRARDSEK